MNQEKEKEKEKEKELLFDQFKQVLNSTSEADMELLQVFVEVLCLELADGQKRLLLYHLFLDLCNEINKQISTKKLMREKIQENPLPSRTAKYVQICNTTSEYEKLRDLIGGILFDALVVDESTDRQIEYYAERFLNSSAIKEADSSMNRKILSCLRGFPIKLCSEDKLERQTTYGQNKRG